MGKCGLSFWMLLGSGEHMEVKLLKISLNDVT